MNEYQVLAEKVVKLLEANDKWIKEYANYADNIEIYRTELNDLKKKFKTGSKNVSVYTSVTVAKSGQKRYNLRYKGQNIGDVVISKKEERTLNINKRTAKTILRDFGFDAGESMKCPWESPQAADFRKHFMQDIPRSNSSGRRNEEHRIENMLLREFSNNASSAKLMKNIQPVKLSGCFYQFPTPLKASDVKNEVKYSTRGWGGIDILCRQGHGKGTDLLVIEVKDEDKPQECPEIAINQAIAYSVFLIKLLESRSGQAWWNLFGFTGEKPKNITIKAAVAMPKIKEPEFMKPGNNELKVRNNTIKLHYISFQENNNKLEKITASF